MPGANFSRYEFTGEVLLVQVRRLDRVAGDIQIVARRVSNTIRDLRPLPNPVGERGVAVYLSLANQPHRERFGAAMRAENTPEDPLPDSSILPVQPCAEQELTVHPARPTFTSRRGKAIRHGAATCPKTLRVLNHLRGVLLDSPYTEADARHIAAALRNLHRA